MLARANQNFRHTSWPVLLDNARTVQPFDLNILDAHQQPTGHNYVEVDGDEQFLTTLHQDTIAAVIQDRPESQDILESQVEGIADNAVNAVFQMGPAVPVATATHSAAGTTGVSPCVAILISGSRGQTNAYGCIHLSANDMTTFDLTIAAIGRLWTTFTSVLGGDPDPNTAKLFAVGGADDDNVSWAELGRVIGACQETAHARNTTFAGANVPINGEQGSVEVYINEDGVTFERE